MRVCRGNDPRGDGRAKRRCGEGTVSRPVLWTWQAGRHHSAGPFSPGVEVTMRIVLVAATVLALAASASAQDNEPMPKDTSNPKQAFYMSAADLAATAAKLPTRPSANTTILERYDASSITGLG